MKAKLEFDLSDHESDDSSEFKMVLQAKNMNLALLDVFEKVFRPSWKHGYKDQELQILIDSCSDNKGDEIVSLLYKIYEGILEDYNIELVY